MADRARCARGGVRPRPPPDGATGTARARGACAGGSACDPDTAAPSGTLGGPGSIARRGAHPPPRAATVAAGCDDARAAAARCGRPLADAAAARHRGAGAAPASARAVSAAVPAPTAFARSIRLARDSRAPTGSTGRNAAQPRAADAGALAPRCRACASTRARSRTGGRGQASSASAAAGDRGSSGRPGRSGCSARAQSAGICGRGQPDAGDATGSGIASTASSGVPCAPGLAARSARHGPGPERPRVRFGCSPHRTRERCVGVWGGWHERWAWIGRARAGRGHLARFVVGRCRGSVRTRLGLGRIASPARVRPAPGAGR